MIRKNSALDILFNPKGSNRNKTLFTVDHQAGYNLTAKLNLRGKNKTSHTTQKTTRVNSNARNLKNVPMTKISSRYDTQNQQ